MEKMHEYGRSILETLNDKGFEAYFVGGYVRDYLLGIQTKDIDITTNAKINDIKNIFDRVIVTGEKFGTVTVLIHHQPFEVTTYRTETTYSNYRHPDRVSHTNSLKEDLARRDFTINQLVMDKDSNIKDYFNGRQDLENKIIRTINNPNDRFEEDALRMLRAFRFSAKLNFSIEANTLDAIQNKRLLLTHIPIERIQHELIELFDYKHSQKALTYMKETSFNDALGPLEKGLNALADVDIEYTHKEALTFLVYYDYTVLDILKLSNILKSEIKTMLSIHQQTKHARFQPEHLFSYKKPLCLRANTVNKMLGYIDQQERINTLYKSLPITSMKDLAFKGEDILKTLKPKNKRHIRLVIDHLLYRVLHQSLPNEKDALKDAAEAFLNELESE
ncbi:MAG: CCA tRNA nucleotidyltransferase [Bacillota bacterium]